MLNFLSFHFLLDLFNNFLIYSFFLYLFYVTLIHMLIAPFLWLFVIWIFHGFLASTKRSVVRLHTNSVFFLFFLFSFSRFFDGFCGYYILLMRGHFKSKIITFCHINLALFRTHPFFIGWWLKIIIIETYFKWTVFKLFE